MNSTEHILLTKISEDLQDLNVRYEHRITLLESMKEKQQEQVDDCMSKKECDTFTSNIKKAIGFLYACLLSFGGAIIYSIFRN